MAGFKRDMVKNLDEVVVKIKLQMIGDKRQESINITASDACKLIDTMNSNFYHEDMTEQEKEWLEKRYIILKDVKTKQYVLLAWDYIKYLEIPFFIESEDEYKLQIADYRKV